MVEGFRGIRAVAWLCTAVVSIAACDTLETTPPPQATAPEAAEPAAPVDAAGQLAAELSRAGGPIMLAGHGGGMPYTPPNDVAPGTARVAVLLPLSGRLGELGTGMLEAAQIAVFDLAGPEFELMVFDTEGSPESASEAARQAVDQGATLILGPLLAASTRAAAPWARAAGVPLISFSSDRRVAGDGVFVIGFTPDAEVERVVQHAASRGITRFAAMAPDTPYGAVVTEALRRSVDSVGGTVTHVELVDPRIPDFPGALERLTGESEAGQTADPRAGAGGTATVMVPDRSIAESPFGFQAILVAEGGDRLRSLAATMPAYGIAGGVVRVLGTGTWDEPWIRDEQALHGGWFAAPDPHARSGFVQSYTVTYAKPPARLASLAFDAAALAAVLGRGLGGTTFTTEILTVPSGFVGSEGIFRFRSNGVAERGLVVMEVTPFGTEIVSDAPESFIGI